MLMRYIMVLTGPVAPSLVEDSLQGENVRKSYSVYVRHHGSQ